MQPERARLIPYNLTALQKLRTLPTLPIEPIRLSTATTLKPRKTLRRIPKSQILRDCSTETELGLLYLHDSACSDGIEKTDAYGHTQIDGVYDIVGGIIANTKQALESAFKSGIAAGTD